MKRIIITLSITITLGCSRLTPPIVVTDQSPIKVQLQYLHRITGTMADPMEDFDTLEDLFELAQDMAPQGYWFGSRDGVYGYWRE